MKSLIIILLVFASNFAIANSKIDLEPGSAVTINSGEITVIACTTSAAYSHFCACGGGSGNMGSGTLIRYDLVDGTKIDTIIFEYGSSYECQNALKNHPSCS